MSPARRPTDRTPEPQALGRVLEALADERRLATGLRLGALERRWAEVVGERLAEESSPAALEGGILLVRASSAAWAAQVKFLAREIVEAASRVLVEGGWTGGGPEEPASIAEVRVVVEARPRAR